MNLLFLKLGHEIHILTLKENPSDNMIRMYYSGGRNEEKILVDVGCFASCYQYFT